MNLYVYKLPCQEYGVTAFSGSEDCMVSSASLPPEFWRGVY